MNVKLHNPGRFSLGCLLAMLLFSMPAAAADVTTCGQIVAGKGELIADLDCTGFPGAAVIVNKGSLNLAGFTLTGGDDDGVFCDRSCRVFSDPPGGSIVGSGFQGIESDRSVRAEFITVSGSGWEAIEAGERLFARGVLASGNLVTGGTAALSAFPGRIKLRESTVTANAGVGVWSGKSAVLVDSDVTANDADGVGASQKVKLKRSTVSGNGGFGVDASSKDGKVTVKESSVEFNTLSGVFAGLRVKGKDSAINSNGVHGVVTKCPGAFPGVRADLRDTTLTGNGTDASCGVSQTCADVSPCVPPKLKGTTTCDTSYDVDSGFPGTSWGVCALD